MKAVESVNFKNVGDFVKYHLLAGQDLRTDAFRGLNIIDKTQPRVTPSKYLQEYLDEFCYRFNHRFVEKQIPNRLLSLAIVYMPFKST
jgi:hypothetical protein